MCHNHWAHTQEPMGYNYWALEPTAFHKRNHHSDKSMHFGTESSPHSLQLEKAREQQQRLSATKNKNKIKITHQVQGRTGF